MISNLGLYEWDVYYEHLEDNPKRWKAQCSYNYTGMSAVLGLFKDWEDNELNEITVIKSAKHEVLELLLAKMVTDSEARCYNFTEAEHHRHEVIQRLIKFIDC